MTKTINRSRNNQLAFRLTDKELAVFNKKQAQSGLSKTDFIAEAD